MRTDVECLMCFGRGALFLARRFGLTEEQSAELLRAVLRCLAEADFRDSPPVNARKVHGVIRAFTGGGDPFRAEKDRSTVCANQLLPLLREDVKSFADELEARVRLAIAGNIIDYGVDAGFDLASAHDRIRETLAGEIDHDELEIFRRAADRAKSILYITDNCGEAVFDAYLMRLWPGKVTAAVRGGPALNDVTRREAEASGLTAAAARLIDTGDHTPGIDLARSSPEFLAAYRAADLIVAKGQGNYETLRDEKERPIMFLLRVKCPVVALLAGNPQNPNCYLGHVNFSV